MIEKYVRDYVRDNVMIGYLDKGGDRLIGEIMEMIKADPQAVVDTLDSFAKDQMNRIKYNKVMERLGYDEERVETKKSII